ncbi:ubiquitin-associated domain-containing protein 2-like [Corticium candelabrum]|uniref:ubiquitin-associated domain-containing protein 2-like n=1 Tax=Corticium candelabrum TaxID=121492 RepID=UPI002E276A9C|nr:ubiquitin-associated domain-containing protein 2-like [Corticium candelabrum]
MSVDTGPSGFYRSPVTKGLILTSCVATAGVALVGTSSQELGVSAEVMSHPTFVLRLLSSQFVCDNLHSCAISSIILYTFRVFERRYGSRKFSNALFSSAVLSTGMHIGILALYRYRRMQLQLATGPYSFVFSLLIPFFLDFPTSSQSAVIPFFTMKTFIYLLAGQLAVSQGLNSLVCAITGMLTGLLWRFNLLSLQEWLVIPIGIADAVGNILAPLLITPSPSHLPSGGTLQIQREQYLDEQERLLVQYSQQFQQVYTNQRMNRRARQNNNHQPFPDGIGMGNSTSTVVQEQQVQQLMEMGFTRQAATHALTQSNNNLEMAMNILVSD